VLKAQVTPIQAFPVALRPSTVIGNPNAPVYLVEYSDFLCDQCFYFKRDVWPQLYANYIATGKVVATYKYWQVRGTSSLYVAQVAECVAQQGKFWQFHDVLYRTWSMASGSFSEQALQNDARALGLDMNRFNDCVSANRTEAAVRADWAEAQRLSRGVPVFIINDEMVWGNQPYALYAEVIERKLRGG
jgi:protein-disulfide isomerase